MILKTKNVTNGTTYFIFKLYTNKLKMNGMIPFMMVVIISQCAKFSNSLFILFSWDSSFFVHYHIESSQPSKRSRSVTFHSPCSPLWIIAIWWKSRVDYQMVAFKFAEVKEIVFIRGENAFFFLSCIFWSS